MTATRPGYDKDLQMFIEPVHEVDQLHIEFMRWLIDHDRFEHQAAGAPAGEFSRPIDEETQP